MEKGAHMILSTISQPDLSLLKAAIATGIANHIVEKVSKRAESTVDKSETERYRSPTN